MKILTVILTLVIFCNTYGQKDNSRKFSDSKGNIITIHTTSTTETKTYNDSEFYIKDKSKISDFYNANNNYKVEILKDTLNIYEIYNLCIGDKFKCENREISKISYYFKNQKLQKQLLYLIPEKSKILNEDKIRVHKMIKNMESFQTNNVSENLKNINNFIKKLEALAIYGDLKSFLKLIELNRLNNPEVSYSSIKATRIILNLNYLGTKKDSIQEGINRYLIYERK